jgi:hypothetical protein
MAKHKFLRVTTKDSMRMVKAQVDVSHLNKKGINQEWDRLDSKFPEHISSLNDQTSEYPPRYFEEN